MCVKRKIDSAVWKLKPSLYSLFTIVVDKNYIYLPKFFTFLAFLGLRLAMKAMQ